MFASVLIAHAVAQAPAAPTAAAAFDRAIRVHAAMRAGDVTVVSRTTSGTDRFQTTYDLQFVLPDRAVMRVRVPRVGNQLASDRTYAAIGRQFLAFDRVANERLSRSFPTSGEVAARIAGGLDDPNPAWLLLLEPRALEELIRPFRGLSGWAVNRRQGRVVVSRAIGSGNQRSTTTWEFDSATGRLLRFAGASSVGSTEWTYTYRAAPRTVDFRPPTGATAVRTFTERTEFAAAPVPYADSSARAVGVRAERTMQQLRHAAVSLRTDGRSSRIWLSAGRVREQREGLEWAWDGAVLTARRGSEFFRGSAEGPEAVDAVGILAGGMDPLARAFVLRRNPVTGWLTGAQSVRLRGEMEIDGRRVQILAIDRPWARLSLFVDRATGLPASIQSESLDGRGDVLSRTQTQFAFAAVGSAQEASLFRLEPRSGQRVQSLPPGLRIR
ncbi:MAG: hypothetical protein SNJ74_02730 [Fimbriimonadaceae bacterium]